MNALSQLAQYYYNYDYEPFTYSTTTVDPAAAAALFAFLLFFGVIIAISGYVLTGIFLGKIFKKAGVPAWAAWVPVYNSWKLLEIGGQQGFWAVLAIIPFVNIVSAIFLYIAMYHVSLKLGKQPAFVILAIFLPLVWMIWLAVDKSTWNDKAAGSKPSLHKPTPPTKPAAA